MNKKIIISAIVILIIFILGFSWWRIPGFNYSGPLEKVTLQLKWLHQSQFAGFYAAEKKGFYQSDGLDVSILPVGNDLSEMSVINRVASGEIQFGVVGGDQVIAARAEGIPIKAIAVIYQQSPVALAALKNSGITTLKDLMGKRMAIEKGQNTETVYRAMMEKAGIDTKKITEVNAPIGLGALAQGEADARMIYLTNEGLEAQEKGYDLNLFYPEDYGIKMYADTLITSDELIAQKPQLVQRFVHASLKGWNWAVAYPDDAGMLSLQYNPDLVASHEVNMMKMSLPFIYTARSSIGGMSTSTWQEMEDIVLNDSGIVGTSTPVQNIFTTEFLSS